MFIFLGVYVWSVEKNYLRKTKDKANSGGISAFWLVYSALMRLNIMTVKSSQSKLIIGTLVFVGFVLYSVYFAAVTVFNSQQKYKGVYSKLKDISTLDRVGT
jgi:hypothetical protein